MIGSTVLIVLAGITGGLFGNFDPSSHVNPPSKQFITAVQQSIGQTIGSDLKIRYIRQTDPTHSLCLITYKKNGQDVFTETLLQNKSGLWSVVSGGDTSWPIHDRLPFTIMEGGGEYGETVTGDKLIGGTKYEIIGGFVSDPSITRLTLVDTHGNPIQDLKMVGTDKFYVFTNISSSSQSVEGLAVKAYDEYGSLVTVSPEQGKILQQKLEHK